MKTLYVDDRAKWRAWLEANSRQATEVWLVYYKKDTGRPSIAYGDAIEEAICFGWIDGKIKNLDQARFARLFMPRKPRSKWSRINIERAQRMIREGKMTAAGSKVFDPRNRTPALPAKLPASLEELFRKQEKAWENFSHFPPSYRRMTIGWVASARQEATQLFHRHRPKPVGGWAMKTSKTAQNPTPESEVYRDFMRLDPERRGRVAVRILRNQKILGDLYDHLLIQRSLGERGENVTWESYKRANGPKP